MLSQIANEEIDDIIGAAYSNGKTDLEALFTQLTEDTYKYPYLMCQLFMKSITSESNSSVAKVISLMSSEFESEGISDYFGGFNSKDLSSIVMGAFFGFIYQKFADKEEFTDPDETVKKILKLISMIKNN